MNIEFLEGAQADLVEAAAYYEEHGHLGSEFLAEVQRAIDRVRQYPLGWAELSPGVRRCRLDRFPYGVAYEIRSDAVLVAAVLHLHRDPKSWRSRLGRTEPP